MTRRALAAALLALACTPAATASAAQPVDSLPVSFAVENVNRTSLPCRSDGKPYRVTGRIVGPREALRGGRIDAATLYLHEYSFGRWFWTFEDVPGLDYATEMARRGHVSVVVDRLGYDGSDHPPGLDTCLGAQADIARQVVEQLRADHRVGKVVLAGHSVGAVAAELAVTSFGDELGVDALLVLALANQGYTPQSLQESFVQGGVCTRGGEPAEEGAPTGYAYYAQTPATWKPLLFASADAAVQDAAAARRNRDPCGDVSSLTPATAHNAARQGDIALPVLLLFGGRDAVYEPGTGEKEAAAFSGSDDVTYREFAGAGHALVLEREAPEVRATVDEWLTARGLVDRGEPATGGGPRPGPQVAPPRPPLPPAAKPCTRRRSVVLRLKRRRGARMTVRVDGRVVLRRARVRPRRIRFSRRARSDGRVTVTAVVRTRDGGTFRVKRRYTTCA